LAVAGIIVVLLVLARGAILTARSASASASSAAHTARRSRPDAGGGDPAEQRAELEALQTRLGIARNEVSRGAVGQPVPVAPPPVIAPSVPSAGPWVWPAPGAITGPFGERRGSSRHPGLDIDGETGDPIVVAVAGKVLWAGPPPAGFGGYGNVVIVDAGNGVMTLYAHLSAWNLQTGQEAVQGAKLGAIGVSGFVTGSHLHFEVRLNNVPVDPETYLSKRP